MREIRIGQNESGQRLDKFLRRYLPGAGSGFLYKMLRKKNITLNGRKATGREILEEGSSVCIWFSEETILGFQKGVRSGSISENGTLPEDVQILYEDGVLLLANKPAGMLTQKSAREEISLTEHIRSHLLHTGRRTEEDRFFYEPGPANRLDRNTSGIVAVPLTLAAASQLSELFRERRVEKRYLALVAGEMNEYRELRAWYLRDGHSRTSRILSVQTAGALPVETHCLPIYTGNGRSLLLVRLVTGKTHQIRSHLKACGYPIIGDPKYGTVSGSASGLRRQFLHAWQLVFPACGGVLEPYSGRCFTAPVPADLLDELEACSIPVPVQPDNMTRIKQIRTDGQKRGSFEDR